MKKRYSTGKVVLFALIMLLIGLVYSIYSMRERKEFIKIRNDTSLEYIENSYKYLDEGSYITVGTISNDNIKIVQYDKNGKVEDSKIKYDFVYEIGSISKTMTGKLIFDLARKGKISIDDSIDKYINLKTGNYPTIRDLLTHSSGYETIYKKNLINFFNPMENFLKKDAIKVMEDTKYSGPQRFIYSNFGYGALGLVIEKIRNKTYSEVLNDYLVTEYGMKDTKVFDKNINILNYENNKIFKWGDSFYKPAGAVISNINDMMIYLKYNMDNYKKDTTEYSPILKQETDLNEIKKYGINFDAVAYGWLVDLNKNIVAHPGELPNSSAFIAFNFEKNVGVVVLINQKIKREVSSKILGAKIINELINK